MSSASIEERFPAVAAVPAALGWLRMRADLGSAPRTIDAYGRGLAEYLAFCSTHAIDPIGAGRDDIARFVRDLTDRPLCQPCTVNQSPASTLSRLSNATVQQRLTAVRLFYDFLVEEGLRTSSPVGRGRYAPGARTSGSRRGLIPRFTRLPWIPDDEAWAAILAVTAREPIRNRTMLALAYDAGLRREELCLLRTDDIDPARRTLRVRAETTKGRRERVVPYSAPGSELLRAYLAHRSSLSRARGALFLSESNRNCAAPLTLWTWSKVVRRIALEAGVPRFSTHTLRHLCLTDLARSGLELHAIATFAGHRSPDTTLQYIHLSGRELAAKLAGGMAQIHDWRIALLTATAAGSA